jgi:DNA primase
LARHVEEPIVEQNKKPFQFPTDTVPLLKNHKRYLEERGFDVERIETVWDLKSIGPTGKLDDKDYKNRILIPFYWNGFVVSFTSRNISSASYEKRYKTCPKDRELLHMKEILYGRQEEWRETGVCVEGPTDVWRFGTVAFATLGVQYTPHQLWLIAKTFRRVAIVYDNDSAGRGQGRKLMNELRFRGVDAFQINIENDPGSMKQSEADYLIKQLIK